MSELETLEFDEPKPEILLTLIVSDHELAAKFYCETLGLFIKRGKLIFKSDPKFALQTWMANSDSMQATLGKQAGDGFLFCLKVENCEAILPKLKSANVQIFLPTGGAGWKGDEIFRLPWGNQLQFADPFGNKICLFDR